MKKDNENKKKDKVEEKEDDFCEEEEELSVPISSETIEKIKKTKSSKWSWVLMLLYLIAILLVINHYQTALGTCVEILEDMTSSCVCPQ